MLAAGAAAALSLIHISQLHHVHHGVNTGHVGGVHLLVQAVIAVSYTHLDVYKRQGVGRRDALSAGLSDTAMVTIPCFLVQRNEKVV